MLTNEQVKKIVSGFDIEDVGDSEVEFEGVKYYLYEREDKGWKSQGKYETNYYIFELVYGDEFIPTGIFIGQEQTRSGSYCSDYYYEFEKLEVVEQIEKTIAIKEWVCKKL